MASEDGGFLSRWARRKAQVREGREPVPTAPVPAPIEAPVAAAVPIATEAQPPVAGETAAEPALTLDDVATLTAESDFSRFVAHDVDPTVKNAALKKLFTDPHYNVMDGLDTYIDDYGKPDPLPEGMLRQMVQSQFLGLFDDEKKDEPAAEAVTAAPTDPKEDAPNEDADLRLQPHHAADAGEPGAGEPGAGEDAAGQP